MQLEYGALLVLFVHDGVALEMTEDDDTDARFSEALGITDTSLRDFHDVATQGLVEVRAVRNWAEANSITVRGASPALLSGS